MAKIRNSHPKESSGGYLRLVRNEALADLLTKAQSTVISNGTELERIITDASTVIEDLDAFLTDCDCDTVADGCYLCTKKVMKKSRCKLDGSEPDFILFSLSEKHRNCYVVELKDGDAFDTKKARSEREGLIKYVNHLAPMIPFRTKYYICCFNQDDKEKIVSGFKSAFSIDEVMTGREFCDILSISYDEILAARNLDAIDNFRYVVGELSAIPDVRKKVNELQRRIVSEKDFYEDQEE